MKRIRDLLMEPRMRDVDVDSPGFVERHRDILATKPIMLSVFRDFYDLCVGLDERWFTGLGSRVEIGAGASLFKQFYPDIIATDIVPSPHLDMVVDALAMPFDDASVRAVYGINCFHHVPDPDRFLAELERVLVPGGGCILIDPFDGLFARWLYPRLFDREGYDLEQESWTTSGDVGVMSGANQALSHVVFVRDRAMLEARHPRLQLVGRRPLGNYPRYFLGGGLNFRQLVPPASLGILRFAERIARPLAPIFAIHHVIVLRRRDPG